MYNNHHVQKDMEIARKKIILPFLVRQLISTRYKIKYKYLDIL